MMKYIMKGYGLLHYVNENDDKKNFLIVFLRKRYFQIVL